MKFLGLVFFFFFFFLGGGGDLLVTLQKQGMTFHETFKVSLTLNKE